MADGDGNTSPDVPDAGLDVTEPVMMQTLLGSAAHADAVQFDAVQFKASPDNPG